MGELLKNNIGIQVLTDTGWSDFSGLLVHGSKQTVSVKTQTKSITCTVDHNFFTPEMRPVEARSLKPGSVIRVMSGIERVVSVSLAEIDPVYDLFEVEKNHRFYANEILVKNCEFIIFDETLVNPLVLAELRGADPIEKQGQIRWYKKPNKDLVYLIGLDPSLGTGGDAAAIEVFELPDFKQVAEWQHNRTPIQNQVLIMADIIKQIAEVVPKTNIYYTVENNTLGEAALISIAEYGEDNISGIFLSEPARTGSSRRYRKGFNTNSKSKLAACAKFKSLLESKRFNIYSKNLLSELKTFVALGGSYQAKIGENDDLIMATLLTVRMAQLLQDYDAELDAKLRDGIDNMVEPLPFVMLTS